MSIFITTLLLASTCLLTHANLPIIKETVTTCGKNIVHRLSCDSDSVISVETALYGRTDSVTCSEGRSPAEVSNTACSLAGVTDVIKKSCNGKNVCELSSGVLGGSDPCRGTAKYLQTTYDCILAPNHDYGFDIFNRVICEHSLADLHCDSDKGLVLLIYGAGYGRRDQTTCAYGRPTSQLQNTACSSNTSKVEESCNGKNSCIIKADNSVFGDPCPGTFKYLEVAYACSRFLKETVTTCVENIVHHLSCDSDGVISVETALYGRTDGVTCSEGRSPAEVSNTDCSLGGVTDVIKKRCNGKKVCELSSGVLGGSDPCRGTAKYLQTTYTCIPAFHRVICEHSLAHLRCDEGQVIVVYGADYGRRDQTTCVYGRPTNQIQNTLCFSPTSKVEESCQGKNSCIIKASNSVFGDLCPGTFKYLEVAYACHYPITPDDQV